MSTSQVSPLRSRSVQVYVRPGHVKSRYGLIKSAQVKSYQVIPNQVKSGQVNLMSGHVSSCQVMSGYANARPGHVNARSDQVISA